MSGWFGAASKDSSERRFVSFEEKSIDEQADEITRALVFDEENPLFEFDKSDASKLKEFQRSGVGACIFVGLVTWVDLRVLNGMKHAKAMGPLRKFGLITVIQSPFYWYFYNDVRQSYMEMKRHLVTKYLIEGDEILYKRPVAPSAPPTQL